MQNFYEVRGLQVQTWLQEMWCNCRQVSRKKRQILLLAVKPGPAPRPSAPKCQDCDRIFKPCVQTVQCHVDRHRWRSHQLTSDLKRCLLFRKCLRWSSRKAVSVPTSVKGGLGAPERLAILSQLPYYLLNTTDNYHLEDLATLSHLPTPLDCISLRTLNLRLNWITSTCFFLLEKLELMVGSSAHLPYFKGLILSYSKNKVFHVILLFWGIFINILMLAGIEFCFRWSSGTQLVNISLE